METSPKPTLLFLRFTRPGLPAYIRLHLVEQVKCLAQYFDVVAIDSPIDYRRLCDEHRPDLTVFESGVYVAQQDIANLDSYPEIPRLGFCHCDAYCDTRKLFIADMARFGVATFFTTSVSLPSYTPSLAENIFVWPNFVDPLLYHDYALPKLVPALFTGSQASHYPWRNRINRAISERYPSIQCPHSGWFDERATSRMPSGEPYARMINASWIAPTCGTIANEVVRKHFEIPACNTCLVTQRTPALEAAGFLDLVNCVFVEETDVLEKVDWLFRHQDELEKITRAGYQLANSQHTMRNRDQVFQWFTLNQQLKAGQRIVQLGPFLPLTIVDRDSQARNGHVISQGLDRVLLAEGDEKLGSGQYDAAEMLYRRCLNYHHIADAKLRLALCYLYKGRPEPAISLISEPIKAALEIWRVEPDPVEWAYLVVALLCRGDVREATARADQFILVCHPELDRVREVIRMVNHRSLESIPLSGQVAYRYSVHQLPERELKTWLDDLRKMLLGCRQEGLAEVVAELAKRAPVVSVARPEVSARQTSRDLLHVAANCAIAERGTKLAGRPQIGRLNVIDWRGRVKSGIGRYLQSDQLLPVRNLVRKCESKAGYVLPFKWSAIRFDEAIRAIRDLLQGTDIKSGLLIGASAGEGMTEAFLLGMGANPNKPRAVCMNFATRRFEKLKRRLAKNPSVQCQVISGEIDVEREEADNFDVVFFDGSEMAGQVAYDKAFIARFVVLDDINACQTFDLCQALLADRNFSLLAHNPSHHGGYAIFQRFIVR